MGISFKDVKSVIDYNSSKIINSYGFPLLPRFNKIVGNIEKGQVHIVSGLPSAGVTSFIDQNYVMSVLLQWYNTDPHERKNLKIFYYSMKDSELKKLQILLCNHLKLVYGLRTDVATLNSQVGRLYDISEDTELRSAIEDSSTFFDEILDDGILTIKEKQIKPTTIYNEIVDYMMSIGSIGDDELYTLDDDYKDSDIIVVVDPVDYFLPDTDGYGVVNGTALHEKFHRQVRQLKALYNITFVLSVPSSTGYIRTPKDTEPHYRHLGQYGPLADRAIIIYNSVAENNPKFYGMDPDFYVTAKGNTLMRTWHVVRNTDGIESVYDRMFFLPGTSYMTEYDLSKDVSGIDTVLNELDKDTYFKK